MSTPKKAKRKQGTQTLRIDGEVTIYRAVELKNTFLAAVAEHAHVELDLSGVTELDSAGVQVLMLAKQVAHNQQRALHLVNHSPAVVNVLDMLNLAAYFGDPLVMPSAA